MKLAKMFGLALAAVAAMAFVGASAAQAEDTEVVFCTENAVLCPAAKIAAPEKFTGKATKPVLLSSVTNIECPSATLSGETLGTAGAALMSEHLPFDVTKLSYGEGLGKGCTGCTEVHTATDSGGIYKGTILVDKNDVYLVHVSGSAVLLHCTIFNVTCEFSSSDLVGTMTNTAGGEQVVTYKEAELKRSGGSGLCPEKGFLDATFTQKAAGGARWVSLFQL